MGGMSVEMQAMVDRHPITATDHLWDDAMAQLRAQGTRRDGGPAPPPPAPQLPGGVHRGAQVETAASPADQLTRLRAKLARELVAFHDQLVVTPYVGARTCPADRKLWQIAVPLTLFPKRDHGFSRIECIVELASPAGPGAFRVVELLPPARAEVLGKLELGGKLDLHTNAKLGMQLALAPSDLIVSDAIAELYGHGEIDRAYELRRDCVVSEIVDGTGGRWRLDDVSRPERVAPEGHQLAIVVEAAPGARPLHLTGYLQAYSDVRWLTSSLGSAWRSFRDQVAAFFHRGMPTEAYGEWRDVLPDAPW